jgi:hypothetical protein
MPPGTSLNTGFLIGTQDKFIVLEVLPVPNPLIEVKDSPSFGGKLRISGKNPGTMLPRLDGVLMQPAPHGTIANCGDKTGLTSVSGDIDSAPTRKRHLIHGRQLASDSFNLDDEVWGEKTGDDPVEDVPRGLQGVPQRNVFATC